MAIHLKERLKYEKYISNSELDSDVSISNNDSTKCCKHYNDSYYDDLYKSQIIELHNSNINETNWKTKENK